MKITKKIASRIALFDDDTPTGGKSHSDEHLDEFMESVMGELPYGSSLTKVNEALVECGIMPITEQQIIDASNPLTISQEQAFERIARLSKMDTWFAIDDKGRVYDREGDVKGKTDKTRRVLIACLIDGMIEETWNALTDEEKLNVVKGLGKCLVF
jgi:hypothetical protein